jgi:hypothetical protein
VVGELGKQRKLANAAEASADQPEIKGCDRDSRARAGEERVSAWKQCREGQCPSERERHVNEHGRDQKAIRPLLAPQEERSRRVGALEWAPA